jgi:RNase P subunit RPR2
MATLVSLTCQSCRVTSRFPTNHRQDSLACSACGRPFEGAKVETYEGCIYVLSNPSMPGLLKIGMTEQDAFQRASELSSVTGVPEPYVVEAYFNCGELGRHEAAVHRLLSAKRKPKREFFSISLDDAIHVIEGVIGARVDYLRLSRPQPSPPSVTLNATNFVRVPRPSSVNPKFKVTCLHCAQAHWFEYRARPRLCPACNTSFDKV